MMFSARRVAVPAFVSAPIVICVLMMFGVFSAHAVPQPPSLSRTDAPLDGAWQFHRGVAPHAQEAAFDDSAWDPVKLPHTWNAKDGEDGGGKYYRGVGWYRTHYTPPANLAGRRLLLQFDAASLAASVYVNGALVGEHRGGFAAFRFDVTEALHVGADNVIAVKVDNAKADIIPLEGDFTVFGGLYRMAHVISTDAVHIRTDDFGSDGVFLTPAHVTSDAADLKILTEVRNDSPAARDVTVKTTVFDAQDHMVTSLAKRLIAPAGVSTDVVQDTVLKKPRLWDGAADPYLYHAVVELRAGDRVIDSVREPLGFRSYAVSPETGFSLNGKYLDLHGVNKHQDGLDQGWAVADAQQDADFALIKELGANIVRLSHYQHSQHTLDLCDKLGIVTWAEIPLIDVFEKNDRFADNVRQQLTELIKQNYNHPAICFWSLSNELGGQAAPLLASLDKTAHTLDPSRLTVLASNRYDYDPINFQTDVLGYNRYFGWYYRRTTDLAAWADRFHARYPLTPFGITEYGAGASVAFHGDEPQPIDHTEEYQAVYHETAWSVMSERPYLWCKLVWNMFDFAVDARKEGDHAGRNDKGLVTYDRRTRKDAFYFYKANWSKEPTVYITGRRYDNRFGAKRTIKVYSSAARVNLVVNGADLGDRTSEDHVFEWRDALMNAGANTVVASATIDDKKISDIVTWQVPPRLPDGGYTITDGATYLRLDAPKTGRRAGAQIREWRADAANNQIWNLTAVADGSYTIQNADSGFYLSAAQIQGNWTLVQQRAAAGPQTWRIEPAIFGSRLVNQPSGMILDNVNGFLTTEGMGVTFIPTRDDGRAGWTLQPALPLDAAGNAIKSNPENSGETQ
ncbi:hypothetical protein CCAX7_41940 [Capsulimonas corticalis]|uniref:Uncharacterized protein n=1 Tax=Capsulimonas corticalis TaxID=2219043 RepID=A0A402CXW7_9BACT|nr:glycoside hydrolase family 2 TIM barrel-domain containing protein [Capsulimonas corticalis]BDI32143.1 hypothetical protein CCAX7_41940 [Capsulimonas corticalis]